MLPPTIIDEMSALRAMEPLLDVEGVEFDIDKHISYLLNPLSHPLPSSFTSLASSQPWIVYWILHSLDLLCPSLEEVIGEQVKLSIIKTLESCQSSTSNGGGGFGGGPGQEPHVACTYATINSLIIIGEHELIDKKACLTFLKSLKNDAKDGSFRVSQGGESDCRALYCCLSVAALLDGLDIIFEGGQEDLQRSLDFLSSCQSFDGGFGATPSTEGHMGYTYCALASITILLEYSLEKGWNTSLSNVDLLSLFRWAKSLQCPTTFGFRGRTHKLVDGCYSFWAGSLFSLGRRVAKLVGSKLPEQMFMMPNPEGLQTFILKCCQSTTNGGGGGLRDKPGKSPDYYHTCYCLSGLSIAQREITNAVVGGGTSKNAEDISHVIAGAPLLNKTDPVHNLRPKRIEKAKKGWLN